MISYFNSQIGWLKLTASTNSLLSIRYIESKPAENKPPVSCILKQTFAELSEYFGGTREKFSIPLNPEGTNFQKEVWEVLQEIPYGQTITYGELAKKLGDLNKVRAVGKANGKNPIPIIIPCHRVIGANNSLTGYAGGVDRKKHLLKHEDALLL